MATKFGDRSTMKHEGFKILDEAKKELYEPIQKLWSVKTFLNEEHYEQFTKDIISRINKWFGGEEE